MFERRRARKREQERAGALASEQGLLVALVRRNLDEDGGLTSAGIRELKATLSEMGRLRGSEVEADEIPAEVRGALAVGLARSGEFSSYHGIGILQPDEEGRFAVGATLMKQIRLREYRGSSRGVSFPIGQGVRLRTSAIRGQLVEVGRSWEVVDRGQLMISDRRVLYTGRQFTHEFRFSKLAGLLLYTDGIAIGVTNRQGNVTFNIELPLIFAQMVRASMEAGIGGGRGRGEPSQRRSRTELDQPATIQAAASVIASGGEAAGRSADFTDVNSRWRDLIDGTHGETWLGAILASHPDAPARTRVLLRDLSVARLVRIANVQHNRCRRDEVFASEGSQQDVSDRAWTLLLDGVADMQMREGTAWTGTVKLLMPGAPSALAEISELTISEVIALCRRLIQVPYAEARRSGIT